VTFAGQHATDTMLGAADQEWASGQHLAGAVEESARALSGNCWCRCPWPKGRRGAFFLEATGLMNGGGLANVG